MKKGQPLIVTGPNASGKSSLFRMLGGLWKVPAGKIERPCEAKTEQITPEDIFFVPQKPYSVRGSLADQITYPKKIVITDRTQKDEDEIKQAIKTSVSAEARERQRVRRVHAQVLTEGRSRKED